MRQSFFKLTLFLCFILSNLLFSQSKNFEIGVLLGGNYSGNFVNVPSNYIYESNDLEDFYKYRFGYFGGVTFNFSFNNLLGVGGDLIYNLKGYNYDGFSGQKDYVRLHYIELPILMNFTFLNSQKLTSCVFLGPYISYLIDGAYEYDYSRNGLNYSGEGSLENYDDFDFGLTGGVALLFPLNEHKIGVDVRYDFGLNNCLKEDYGGDWSMKNSSFMLGIKFLFNLKQKSSFEQDKPEEVGDNDIWN